MTLVEELREYVGPGFKDDLLAEATGLLAESWRAKEPRSNASIRQWYRDQSLYLYDLTAWHMTRDRQCWTRQAVEDARTVGATNILDFGCGIGQDGLALIEAGFQVTFADLRTPTLQYLKWRLRKRKLPVTVLPLATELDLQGAWDLGLCLDVIEHVPQPGFTLHVLANACRHLVLNQPMPGPQHPQHLLTRTVDLSRYGMVRVGTTEPPLYRCGR